MTDVSKLLAVPFTNIPTKEVDPLWEGWFLRRHVTLLVAPGGTGKGLLTIDMAARVTTGRPFPGEPESAVREPEAVILVAPEDDPNEAVAWRLTAAGADQALVFNLTVFADGTRFTLPESVNDGTLQRAVAEVEQLTGRHVGLIVIDPLYAVSSVNLATNKGARAVIDPLEVFAAKQRAALVLTHHSVKSGATAGSKGLTDACRVVLRIGRPDKDKASSARALTVEKANALSDSETGIRYVITGTGNDTCLVWPVEVEELAEKMKSSRGYEISEDSAVPADDAEGHAERFWELYQSGGGHRTAKVEGEFATPAEAQSHAEKLTGHKLTWQAGPVADSSGAQTTDESGGFLFFSVLPDEREINLAQAKL
jgi:hypothetical protein